MYSGLRRHLRSGFCLDLRMKLSNAGEALSPLGVARDLSASKDADSRVAILEAALAELQRTSDAKSAELHELAEHANRMKEAAESSNRAKSEFLSSMSHELRTPLTAILGFTELIQDGPRAADVPGYLQRIRENGLQLLGLVDDILDLSRIEAGRAEVIDEPFSLAAVLMDVVESCREQAIVRGLTLEVFIGLEIPESVEADISKFRQLLRNLISNAIKFTHTGGVLVRMLIDPLPEPPQLRVDVVDTGIGIPANKLSTLFEPFTQVDNSLSRKYGGTGLGLALCKRYCELLGGTIEVSSLPGRGSNFTFWISFQNTSIPTAPARSSGVPGHGPEFGLEGRHVLIVEDNPANMHLLHRILQKAGATVCDAADGLLGVESIRAALDRHETVDAILMDMQMPVMDGYTATSEIRRLTFTGPIIAVTADTTDRARVNSLAAGCDAYLTKPVNRREVINLLQRLLLITQHRQSAVDQVLMWE